MHDLKWPINSTRIVDLLSDSKTEASAKIEELTEDRVELRARLQQLEGQQDKCALSYSPLSDHARSVSIYTR